MTKLQNKSVAECIDKYLESGLGVEEMLDLFRNSVMVHALSLTHGNVSKCAEMLKIHRNSCQRWMTEFHLKKETFHESDLEPEKERDENNLEPGTVPENSKVESGRRPRAEEVTSPGQKRA